MPGGALGVFSLNEAGIEIGEAVARIMIEIDRAARIIRFIHAKIVDSIRFGAE